jgi:hypothetical protein
MLGATVGSDVYGAVRRVGRTPIVTKFAMLQFLPLIPLESYYFERLNKPVKTGIPVLARFSEQGIVGLRLARINWLSVAVTYVRALGAGLTMIGTIGLAGSAVSHFSMPLPNEGLLAIASTLILVTAAAIALPTYYFTFSVSDRDKAIRTACASVVGIAADPAYVTPDIAENVTAFVDDVLPRDVSEVQEVMRAPHGTSADVLVLLLLRCRAMIALGGDREGLERMSDDLLLAMPRGV